MHWPILGFTKATSVNPRFARSNLGVTNALVNSRFDWSNVDLFDPLFVHSKSINTEFAQLNLGLSTLSNYYKTDIFLTPDINKSKWNWPLSRLILQEYMVKQPSFGTVPN